VNRRRPTASNLRAASLLALALGATGCASRSAVARAPVVSVAAAAPAVSVPAALVADPGLSADVVRLTSPDFLERTRAAARLVAAGEAALPALGGAGDQPVRVVGDATVGTTAPVARAILDALPEERVRPWLDAPWPLVRREAAQALGRHGRWASVPSLIARLSDADGGVRASTIEALRRITNEFLGYRPHAAPHVRAAAVARWREWWAVRGSRSQPADGAPTG
jgi:hypothetical protein